MVRIARVSDLSVLVVAIALSASGCASWKTVDREHIASAVQEKPHLVRVGAAGSVYHLQGAQLFGDTLQGFDESVPPSQVDLPVSSINTFAVRKYHPTTFIVVTGAIAAAATMAAIEANGANHGIP